MLRLVVAAVVVGRIGWIFGLDWSGQDCFLMIQKLNQKMDYQIGILTSPQVEVMAVISFSFICVLVCGGVLSPSPS